MPEQPLHGAVAAPYAHVTAPLRRLADRYVTEVCLALHAGTDGAAVGAGGAARLPEMMSRTDRVANAAERGAVDLVEAVLLRGRIGEGFDAAVLDVDGSGTGRPSRWTSRAVRARCEGRRLPLGERDPGQVDRGRPRDPP